MKQLLTAIAVLAAFAISACGEKEEAVRGVEPQEFNLALDFYINPDHAGLYTALERGFFDNAGLDVRPRVPSDPSAPIKQVAAGRADLAISYEPEVLLARDQGLDVVAVAALVDEPLTSVIWTADSGLTSVSDLAGKTLVTAGIPYQQAFLEAIAEEAGIDPESISTVDVGLDLQAAVLSGRADAMLGGFRNIEGVDLEERGASPTVLPVNEIGIPNYDELVLIASRERLEEDPEEIELFISALARGTRAAAADAEAASELIVEAGDGLDPGLTLLETETTLPLLLPTGGERFGEMNLEEWQEFAGFLYDKGQLSQRLEASDAITNELLPGPAGAE